MAHETVVQFFKLKTENENRSIRFSHSRFEDLTTITIKLSLQKQ